MNQEARPEVTAKAGDIWLSVITPVLNAERYIGGCIENVMAQNAAGVEQIIMDGVSTDQTLAIVRSYAEKSPAIRIISEKDGSQAAAMNHGIRLARGPVIGFLNADDYYEPNVLNRVAGLFKGLPEPAMVMGNCNMVDEGDNFLILNRPNRISLLEWIKGREFPWNPSSYFYHKSLHDLVGWYDEKEHFTMDVDFLMRAVQKAHIFYFDEVWGNFRWIEGAKTFGQAKEGMMEKRIDAVRTKYMKDLSLAQRVDLEFFKVTRQFLRPAYLRLRGMLKGH